MLDYNEITSSEIICNGDGRDSIANTYSILPGIDCEDGGIMLETGTDLDGNGMLDYNEITSSEIICNGVSGEDGEDGAVGATGASGYDSLIASSSEPAGSNCANGGHKMEIGSDLDRDGQMDANEISNTLYICDGEDGVAVSIPWVDITGIPSDIADGDDDTTYDGSDFAMSGNSCSNGQVMMGISSSGNPICVIDNDTTVSGNCPSGDYFMTGISANGVVLCSLIETYDGSDFAISGQTCPTGQYVKEIDSNGDVQCSSPESGNPIMPGSITGGSYMNDAPLSGSDTLFHQFIATDSGSYDTITYFYTGSNGWHGTVYVAIYDDNQGHPGNLLTYNYQLQYSSNTVTLNQNTYNSESIGSQQLTSGELYWVAIQADRQFGGTFYLAENADYNSNRGLVQSDWMSNWHYNSGTGNDDRAFWFMIS